jgi:hypothetical protein
MTTTLDLINAIESGKTLDCERVFADLVQAKVEAAFAVRADEVRAEMFEGNLEEAVTDRVSFSGKDSSGNEKTIHFGKNNGNPYHVIQGKPGTNFSASAVINTGAGGHKGAEEHMSKVAELAHAGKHKEALDHLNKHSHIKFQKTAG